MKLTDVLKKLIVRDATVLSVARSEVLRRVEKCFDLATVQIASKATV